MAKTIIVGGRYYDKETGEYIIIEDVDDVITYVFESGGEIDTWDVHDMESFAESLVAANDIALAAERGVEVKVKKLHEDAKIPEYKTLGAAGFDLSIIEDVTVPPNRVLVKYVGEDRDEDAPFDINDFEFVLANDNHAVVGTGLAFEIPVGHELEIRSRSGLGFNHKVMAFNGTIDSDYRSEVKLLITNLGKEPITFKKGDRVAQGIIKRVEQVNFVEADALSKTERGEGGFGSTGLS